MCISALDTGLEVPEIETFDDLQKKIDQQRTSQPTKSDFMEVSDTFAEEDLIDSVKAVRIAVKLLFKFQKDEEGFYEFAIAPKYRNAVINAEKYLFNYYKEVYERREARDQSIEATPDLTKEEWEVYDTICKILEHSPISTDEIKEKMTTLKADIAKLIEETKRSISEFASLREDSTVCPKAFEKSVDDFSGIEELYHSSIDDDAAKKRKSKSIINKKPISNRFFYFINDSNSLQEIRPIDILTSITINQYFSLSSSCIQISSSYPIIILL